MIVRKRLLFQLGLILIISEVGRWSVKGQDDGYITVELDEVDLRRPIWNVAHMVNAIYQVDEYLDRGANTIEFDIAFDSEGTAKYTFHGVPCDCFRTCLKYERIPTYLDYMRQLTTPGDPNFREQLILLFMDAKLSGLSSSAIYNAGRDVAEKLVEYYWKNGQSGARANILLSIPYVQHERFIDGFRDLLSTKGMSSYFDRIGIDFSGNEDLNLIQRTYKNRNQSTRIWQGDGITNCLPRGTSRLRDALSRRDRNTGGSSNYIDKVYWWTVDRMSTMRTVLRLGVDAMITNYPERLVRALKESEFSQKFRLATIQDDPWKRYASPFASLVSYEDSLQSRGGNITEEEILYNGDDILYNC